MVAALGWFCGCVVAFSTYWLWRSLRRTSQGRDDDAYRRGYRYAAGEMLRWDPMGPEPDPLDRLRREALDGKIEALDEYRRGIWDALHDWNRWLAVRANL